MNGCAFHDHACDCPVNISLNDVERAFLAGLIIAHLDQQPTLATDENFMLMALWHKMADNNLLVTRPEI